MEVIEIHAASSFLRAGQIFVSPWLSALQSWKDIWHLPRNAAAINHSRVRNDFVLKHEYPEIFLARIFLYYELAVKLFGTLLNAFFKSLFIEFTF